MKFFYPDSLDVVDPGYDFQEEQGSHHRVRHRDDVFAHGLLSEPPYDGILLSHSMVYGNGGKTRYSQSQRFRLLRAGASRFFETDRREKWNIEIMGDCGAYAYVDQDKPPLTVEEALDFYRQCQCDYVLSVDHVIPGFITEEQKENGRTPKQDWKERQQISLELARSFLQEHQERDQNSVPIGVAQGWDQKSYTRAIESLQKMGYHYIALGGLAALATEDIAATVEQVSGHLRHDVRLHLLGVSRANYFQQFREWGVVSFDSTMPVRQAFMDDKHNYHTLDEDYLAIRVPKVSGSPKLQRKVKSGEVSASKAFKWEREALNALRQFDRREISIDKVLSKIQRYEVMFNGRDQTEEYERLLENRPWEHCECNVCQNLGIEVVLLRGRERNKRRGFHNMKVLSDRIADRRGVS